MNPKVSIIIPAYNSEKYIAQAIESVLQQTEPNFEVIVVDDASVDATVDVVRGYCSDRLKLIVNERNQGPSYTRNRGIGQAKGQWIALLDSDDWYAPNRLEKLLQVAQAENADFVADDLYLIEDGAETPWSTRFSQKQAGFGSCKVRCEQITQINAVDFVDFDLGLLKPLIKRHFLVEHEIEFDPNLRYGEDFQFFLISLLKGAKFIIFPEAYYFYCSRPNSLVTEYIKCQEQMHKSSLNILQKELNNNYKLSLSLSKRLAKLEKSIKIGLSYNRVIIPLKKGKLTTAITEMIRNPLCFVFYSSEISRKLNYRFSYLLSKLSTQTSSKSNYMI